MAASTSTSRSNSIEISSETTLNQLRGMDMDISLGDHPFGGRTGARRNTTGGKMGQSLNFLNLDRRQTTVGGNSPRLALMQLRINRLKKTSPSERLYQSDSALFSSANAGDHHAPKNEVWFKSQYPKSSGKGALCLEKLEEAEQEFEDSQSGDMENDMNTSGTDLWLFEANHSAPGFLPGDKGIEEEEKSHIRRES